MLVAAMWSDFTSDRAIPAQLGLGAGNTWVSYLRRSCPVLVIPPIEAFSYISFVSITIIQGLYDPCLRISLVPSPELPHSIVSMAHSPPQGQQSSNTLIETCILDYV